jgi:hypothetical protein
MAELLCLCANYTHICISVVQMSINESKQSMISARVMHSKMCLLRRVMRYSLLKKTHNALNAVPLTYQHNYIVYCITYSDMYVLHAAAKRRDLIIMTDSNSSQYLCVQMEGTKNTATETLVNHMTTTYVGARSTFKENVRSIAMIVNNRRPTVTCFCSKSSPVLPIPTYVSRM